MNKRLQCIKTHIPPGIGMIDVGTDHGYLPAALAKEGYPGALYASDLRPGPLSAAHSTAEAEGFSQRIEFQLCDGLALCPPEKVDCIVIAGMGGDNICGILDRAEWCMDAGYTLVLQPMTKAEVLRYWLIYNEFSIVAEDLVEDGGRIYSVIVARFGGRTRLTDAELFSGALEQVRSLPLFPMWIASLCERFEKKLKGMRFASVASQAARTLLYTEILNELKEMKAHAP